MKIDTELLDSLSKQAKASPRLRMNYDLRTTPADTSQRMLNALEPGTVLPVHRHRTTTEVVIIIRGRATQYFYDNTGRIDEIVTISDNSECKGIVVEKGRWHRIESIESGTVILECKDGSYTPISDDDILNITDIHMNKEDLKARILEFVEMEGRSCSMDPALITPVYIARMLGPIASIGEIEDALKEIRN